MRVLGAMIVLGLATTLGCEGVRETTPVTGRDASVVADRRPPVRPRVETRVIGQSVEGRPISATVVGHGVRTVLVMATIHGDEPAGTPIVERLIEQLQDHPIDVRVIAIPVVNPDGLAHRRRTNVNGVDLNRNFRAPNFSAAGRHGDDPLSEPESRAIDETIAVYRPQLIISFHQPLDCVDYDGDGATVARAMADAGPLPINRLGTRPGSLGAYGQSIGIPVITVELPGQASRLDADELWARYGAMTLAGVGTN